jgi:thiamine pyrophosphokinase
VSTLLRPDDTIIAADGGTRHVLAIGRLPEAIVGDMDSLSSEARRLVESAEVSLVSYPQDKDETDLELAIRYALDVDASEILMVGILGLRLDHTLGNLALLSDPALAKLDIRTDDGMEQAFFCRTRAEIHGKTGDIVSLIPWGQPAKGVRTDGLRWPLGGETLHPQKTRGISNEMLGSQAHVELASGLLLIVHRRTEKER